MGSSSQLSVWVNMVGNAQGTQQTSDSHNAKTELSDVFHLGKKKKKRKREIFSCFSSTKMFYEFMSFPLSRSFRHPIIIPKPLPVQSFLSNRVENKCFPLFALEIGSHLKIN